MYSDVHCTLFIIQNKLQHNFLGEMWKQQQHATTTYEIHFSSCFFFDLPYRPISRQNPEPSNLSPLVRQALLTAYLNFSGCYGKSYMYVYAYVKVASPQFSMSTETWKYSKYLLNPNCSFLSTLEEIVSENYREYYSNFSTNFVCWRQE